MIGYYVHHQGAGHLARALAIAQGEPTRFTLLGSGVEGRTGAVAAVDLPDDRPMDRDAFDGFDGTSDRPEALHYAPIGHEGVRSRVAAITDWIATRRPALLVVDVSVEVAMLARLAATPTIYVRLSGRRTDPAHLDAFRGALALLAPFHADLEDPATPDWVRAKTWYAPGLIEPVPARAVEPSTVVVIFGAGGGQADGEGVAAAARRTPDLTWRVLGPMTPVSNPPSNLVALGWVEDVIPAIASAGVVVGSAGDGVVAAVLAADRPFVCLPQTRAFDEQASKAKALAGAGAAIALDRWPQAKAWPGLLAQARALSPSARRQLIQGADASAIRDRLLHLAACADRPGDPP